MKVEVPYASLAFLTVLFMGVFKRQAREAHFINLGQLFHWLGVHLLRQDVYDILVILERPIFEVARA